MQEAHVESCSWNYKLLTGEDKTEKQPWIKSETDFLQTDIPAVSAFDLCCRRKSQRGGLIEEILPQIGAAERIQLKRKISLLQQEWIFDVKLN